MKKLKYLFVGDAESVHLVKWIREIVLYADVYVLSIRGIHPDIKNILYSEHCFLLNKKVNSDGGNIGILKLLFKVNKVIHKVKPDVVNAHYITSSGLLVSLVKRLFFRKFTFIASAWGSDIMVTPDRNFAYKWITRFALNSADMVTSDANIMTQKIHSLSNVNVMTFTFGLNRLPEFNLQEKNPNLFFSNRILSENYNIDSVIRCFKYQAEKNPYAKLIIGNDGNKRKELEYLVKSLELTDNIEFVGFMRPEEQEQYYRKAQFYISLPISDATSVSLLEAMAWGCIPIVSNIPANHEWIENEVNGIILMDNKLLDLGDVFKRREQIAEINRRIISDRAIFPDSVKKYYDQVLTIVC